MADIVTTEQLQNASLDVQTIEKFVNGSETQVNNPRLLPDVDIGSIAELRKKVQDTVDLQIATLPAGHKGYATLADAQAAQASLPANTLVEVTNDTTVSNNGVYLWNGTTLTKSTYDVLTSAKAYVDEKIKISLDDPEYVLCISDSDSNLLFAITRQGEVIGDFKVVMENIENLPTALTKVFFEDNLEGELYEIVDPQGNILAQVESDGTWVLPAIRTTTLDSTAINGGTINLGGSPEGELYEIADPQGNILARVESDGTWVLPAIRTTTLDSTEITGGNLNLEGFTEADITKEKLIRIPEQNYLRLDLSFVSLPTDASDARVPTTGTCTISDSSKSIIYARANAEMAVQGEGSAGDKKKNYTIDFYNIDGDALKLKFGDSIASDSYHLKGFYRDPTHMRDQGGYRCWKELVQKLDYPYSKINNIVYSASPSRPMDAEFTADAKYYPHGFPVEVYLNGNFYGLHTLRLKKSRQNYALDNSNINHIFLDSGTYTALLKEPFDATDWEIKSPKMKGYTDLGPIPSAFVDTVGASCTRLFEFTRTLSTSYVNHADYIVLPHWVLFYLMCELTGDWDHNGNNYNIITWNNQQWSIFPYDLDWTLNWFTNGFGNTQSTNLLSSDIWTTFRNVFAPEIKSLWTKYRKNGDITVEKVAKHYRNAVSNVPREVYKADKDKWGSYPYFENVNYPDLEQVYRWFEARIAFLDSKYLIV